MESALPPQSEAQAANNVIPDGAPSHQTGLNFCMASKIEEVIQAWELVYRSYLKIGLIDPNPLGIHTTLQAIGPQTAVILGKIGQVPVSTLSTFFDNPAGLPLDSVYHRELNELRNKGHKLIEIGLFADRRDQISRSLSALIEMMRHAYYLSLHSGNRFIVIGVNPHHVLFYKKYFSFERFAPDNVYPTVRNHPVVPLALNLEEALKWPELPRGLAHFQSLPMPAESLSGRYAFDPASVSSSILGQFQLLKKMKSPPTLPQARSA